ncbi:hypothetical protein 1 [Beihai picorna-like virus 101]|uniref:hypothetical protein 1 n=1 Tax=Beihai picorna-like virus 101 TaxID=1922529 RepID=UPI00090CAC95|nr:hypothetical protein 1 [Beihai picorna-like virus 101]APG76722.1 hypothetical protein 1 [Beihai picorna-like virus 101]
MDTLYEFFQQFQEVVLNTMGHCEVSRRVCSKVIALGWFIYDLFSGKSKTEAILRFVTVLGPEWSTAGFSKILSVLSTACLDIYKSIVERAPFAGHDDEIHTQAQSETLISSFVQVMLHIFDYKNYDELKVENYRVGRITSMAKLLRSCDTILSISTRMFSLAWEWVSQYLTDYDSMIDALELKAPEISRWVLDFDSFENNCEATVGVAITKSDSIARQAIALNRRTQGFTTTLDELNFRVGFITALNVRIARCQKYAELAKLRMANLNVRKCPFAFYIYGNAGLGKSHMVRFIVETLYASAGESFNYGEDTFIPTDQSKYWEGYNQQKVYYENDLFSSTDTVENSSTARKLITTAQTVPMPLNYANVDLKGTGYFNSEIIVADGNGALEFTQLCKIMHTPDALWRRFNFSIHVTLKDEWKDENGRFNISKATQTFHTEAYSFKIIRGTMEKRKELQLDSWEEFMEFMVEEFAKHRNIQDRNVAKNNNPMIFKDTYDKHRVVTQSDTARLMDPDETQLKFIITDTYIRKKHGLIGAAKRLGYWRTLKTFFSGEVGTTYGMFTQSMADFFQRAKETAKRRKMILKIASAVVTSAAVGYMIYNKFTNTKEALEDVEDPKCIAYCVECNERFKRNGYGYKYCGECMESENNRSDVHNTPHRGRLKKIATARTEGCGSKLVVGDQDQHLDADKVHVGRRHRHTCKCGTIFEHTHRFRERSMLPSMCHKCNQASFKPANFGKVEDVLNGSFTEGSALSGIDDMLQRMTKSIVKISVVGGMSVCGFWIAPRVLATSAHLFDQVDNTSVFRIFTMHNEHVVHIDDVEAYAIDAKVDIALMRFNSDIIPNAYPIVYRHIARAEEIVSLQLEGAMLSARLFDGRIQMVQNYAIPRFIQDFKPVWNHSAINAEIVETFRYNVNTEKGDCGSIIIAKMPNGSGKIIGIHAAGGRAFGIGSYVTQEKIERLMDDVTTVETQHEVPILPMPQHIDKGTPICATDNLCVLGQIPAEYRPVLPVKSTVTESQIHGIFPITCAPAQMSVKGDLDPLRIGVMEMARKNMHLPRNDLKSAGRIVEKRVLDLNSRYKAEPRLLTFEEMCVGIPGDPYVKVFNIKTSPGYPWKLCAKQTGKKDFFDENGLVTGYAKTELERVEQMLKDGIKPFVIGVDMLKDERREIEKVEQGKTRVFTVLPFHINLLLRKYTAYFQAHCMENACFGPSAVGINPHSPSWGILKRRLERVGDNFIAGDYKKWDKWVPYPLMMEVCKIINNFYDDGPENARVRTMLFDVCFSMVRLCGDVLYSVSFGLPSGMAGTSIFNSIANEILFCTAFCDMSLSMRDSEKARMWLQGVEFTAYGDDHIVSVIDDLKWFNMETYQQWLKSHGVEYTNASKGDVRGAFVKPCDLTYLKRHFVERDGHCYAPLDIVVVQESISWCRGTPTEAQSIACIRSALFENVHHGIEQFNKFERRVKSACADNGIKYPIVFFNEVDRDIRDGSFDDSALIEWCEDEL